MLANVRCSGLVFSIEASSFGTLSLTLARVLLC
jgi:hypothetical protein